MKPTFIHGKTLDDTYFQLLRACWFSGVRYEITTGSFAGSYRLEFPFASGYVEFPHTRPLAPIFPSDIPPVTNDEKIEHYFWDYLMNPELEKNEEYRYATWINGEFPNQYRKDEPGKNYWETQLDWIIRHFKEKGYGNAHCFLTVGHPTCNFIYDKPYDDETGRGTSPCLRGLDFKIKEGKLMIHVIYRSWDLYAGWPENMGGFTLLNQYVCDQIDGVEPGPMMFSSAGLHCYSHQIDPLKAVLRIKE